MSLRNCFLVILWCEISKHLLSQCFGAWAQVLAYSLHLAIRCIHLGLWSTSVAKPFWSLDTDSGFRGSSMECSVEVVQRDIQVGDGSCVVDCSTVAAGMLHMSLFMAQFWLLAYLQHRLRASFCELPLLLSVKQFVLKLNKEYFCYLLLRNQIDSR